MKILSVSVAAYNVQAFIRQCLNSFVASGALEDVEILVTDDGSRDDTPGIVAEFEKAHPGSIRLIRQENQGPGSTVRSGISHASGRYFRMVDGDDWVDPAAFADLVARLKASRADLVLCSFCRVDEKTGEKEPAPIQKPRDLPYGREVPFERVCENALFSMHSAVFRTELLKEVAPRILNGFYTDMQYLLLPAPQVKTVEFFEGEVYQYRVSLEGQSVSYPSMQKNVAQHRAMLASILALSRDYAARPDAKKEVAAYLRRHAAFLSGTQMGIDLSFPPTKEAKGAFYAFYDKLKSEYPDVFREFKKLKTAKVLAVRPLYGLASRLHRKRIGM